MSLVFTGDDVGFDEDGGIAGASTNAGDENGAHDGCCARSKQRRR